MTPATTTPEWPWPLSFASGMVGAALASLGFTMSLVVLAASGSYVGMMFAPAMGRYRAVAVFLCTSLACSKFGVLGGALVILRWPDMATVGDLAGGIACALGLLFHPLLAMLIELLPVIRSSAAKRLS